MSSSSDPIPQPQGSTPPPSTGSDSPAAASYPAVDPATDLTAALRPQPIPPPSEPLQYRAIGLVRGRYTPSSEQFTQGSLTTPDSTVIDTVLLGRVMSLVRKHLDLDKEHLWVVYPRTREQKEDLHVQIVGVWEPEKLTPDQPVAEETSPPEPSESDAETPNERLTDGYFSIRGEVVYQSQDQEQVVVKIKQAPRKTDERPRSFKLNLKGVLPSRGLGQFWDFHVLRQGSHLLIQEATSIAELPSRRKPKPGYRKPMGRRKPGGSARPIRPGDRPQTDRPYTRPQTGSPPPRREPPQKPIKPKRNPPPKPRDEL